MPTHLTLTDRVSTDELAGRYSTCRDPAECSHESAQDRGPLHLVSAWAMALAVLNGSIRAACRRGCAASPT